MTSIATLGIEVKSTGVAEAERQLDKLTQAGGKAEKAMKSVAQATEESSKTTTTALGAEARAMQESEARRQRLIALVNTQRGQSILEAEGLRNSVAGFQAGGRAMAGAALSAKQLAFATRGLPAQFTDIATSLAQGQRPLNVLLQQGGQLKDMFGGIGPAAAAMGRYVVGLVNPFTLAAAAVIGLGAAALKSQDNIENLNKALILTGNNAGLSVRQLQGMASELDRTTNATASAASGVLAQVASTGQFTADQIRLVSEAAINMEDATGKATDATVKDFQRLKDAPLDYILQLNKAGDVNHFLTEEVERSIEKLEDQGDKAGAAKLAFEAYANAINSRTGEINNNLSSTSAIWRDLKSAIFEAGDSVVSFFTSADQSMQAFLAKYQNAASKIANVVQHLPIPGFSAAGLLVESMTDNAAKNAAKKPSIRWRGDEADTVDSDAVKARRQAEQDFARLVESNLTKQQRLEAEIASIRKTGVAAGKSELEIDQQIAAARARAAEGAGGGGRARSGGSARSRVLPDFAKGASDELAKLAEQEDRATQSFLDLQASLQGPLAEEMRDHEKRVSELNELAKQSPTAMAGLNDALALEAKRHEEAARAAAEQANPLGALLDDMRFELDTIGKSNAERAVMNELRRDGIPLMSEEARGALATANAFAREAEAKQRSIDLMDDFRRGFTDALTDFVTGAKSAKEAFKDLFDGIAQQITRAIAQHWADQLFGQQGTSGGGSAGGWFQSILGALFGDSSFGSGPEGFASGGYTGDGPRDGVAGVVHYGEVVVPAKVVDDIRTGRSPQLRAGPSVLNQTIVVQGLMRDNTPMQLAQASAREQARARRNA